MTDGPTACWAIRDAVALFRRLGWIMSDEQQRIIDTVRCYLEPHQPPNYRLNVSETGLRHSRDDWWYIVVKPSQADIRAREYSDIMEQIEDQIKSQRGLKVLLVPTQPDD